LKELDISLNEIGPVGFQHLCDVLPNTRLTSLSCARNFLLDSAFNAFTSVLSQTQLRKFDFSNCKLSDNDMVGLIDILSMDKQIQVVKVENNYFSEQIEPYVMEQISKN
jgi:Leucine-rich repeat (LRR) protein